jgi:hypothetical protein
MCQKTKPFQGENKKINNTPFLPFWEIKRKYRGGIPA